MGDRDKKKKSPGREPDKIIKNDVSQERSRTLTLMGRKVAGEFESGECLDLMEL